MVAIASALVATALGLGLLTPEAAALARKALGITLILYGIVGLARIPIRVPQRAEPWLGPVMGLANGAVTTMTGMFMIPVIPYIQSLELDRDDFFQAQGISFTVSTCSLSVVLIANGTLNTANALISVLAMVAALVGMAVGQYVRRLVRPEMVRFLFFVAMLALGIHLALIR